MQTFLPYPSFEQSAACLDRQRLGKQRVEAKQILMALNCPVGDSEARVSSGWRRHPAVRMWAGHERALSSYAMAVCREWRGRGYKDALLDQFATTLDRLTHEDRSDSLPQWIGWDSFHASHRSNLLRKDAEHYGRLGWSESDDLPYVWPVE